MDVVTLSMAQADAKRRLDRARRRSLPRGQIVGGLNRPLRDTRLEAASIDYTHRTPLDVFVPHSDPSLRFCNYNAGAVGEGPAPETVTFRSRLELPDGKTFQITSRGSIDLVLAGGHLDTDPIGVEINVSRCYVRTKVISGLPYAITFATALNDEAYHTTIGDQLTAAAASFTGRSAWVFGPSLMFGTPEPGKAKPVFGIVGDSIAFGMGDANYYDTSGGGHFSKVCTDNNLPWVNVSRPGAAASDWLDQATRPIRWGMVADCDYIFDSLGGNDLNGQAATDATVRARRAELWRSYAKRGQRVLACTITPVVSGTYDTLEGQTVAALHAQRIAHNDWVRAGCPLNSADLTPVNAGTAGALLAGQSGHPVVRVLDLADTVESARNSGKWRVDGGATTYDGLHPTSRGFDFLRTGVDVSNLTI